MKTVSQFLSTTFLVLSFFLLYSNVSFAGLSERAKLIIEDGFRLPHSRVTALLSYDQNGVLKDLWEIASNQGAGICYISYSDYLQGGVDFVRQKVRATGGRRVMLIMTGVAEAYPARSSEMSDSLRYLHSLIKGLNNPQFVSDFAPYVQLSTFIVGGYLPPIWNARSQEADMPFISHLRFLN
jgi:hypothetical protein